jgi:peptidyl-prolyl cis-trans isomerase B (cyclophilin B)
VRAAAAAVSVSLGDAATAATLAGDREPNVQTAALDALFRLRSPAVVPRAIDALRNGDDHQLLRMAALVLKGLPESAKEDASDALLTALRTLTAQEADTSRVARVAILERLAETLKPARGSDVLPFLGDYDDDVRTIATKTYLALVPPPHPRVSLRRRYPLQPPLVALNSQPTQATIVLEDGPVTLRLLPDVAPVTVARFAELASRGYYNGLTFHRVVPNFFVQGGSPGANDYSGTPRYMRDEVGPQAVHVRGAVGMSTRGKDMGDGQFFIDLVDLPQFDRDYTVFAYVTRGMEFVDRLLEGAKIVSVSVK